jgi:SAM-dependent methyltransferase
MLLVIHPDLALPRQAEPFLSKVSLDLYEDDAMYGGNDRHYLSCGASALNVILSALRLADQPDPSAILDFGSGAGRVTRWLRSTFILAALDTCDLREQDLQFCRDTFQARTWVSGTSIEDLQAPDKYDLIWLGSVVTHLSSERTELLLRKMLSWLRPRGIVVMSLHGRYALQRQSSGEFRYIDDAGWGRIKVGYETVGFGYSDYEGQKAYGISLTKPSWMASLAERLPGARMIMFSEQAWDDHHDVVAIQSV